MVDKGKEYKDKIDKGNEDKVDKVHYRVRYAKCTRSSSSCSCICVFSSVVPTRKQAELVRLLMASCKGRSQRRSTRRKRNSFERKLAGAVAEIFYILPDF